MILRRKNVHQTWEKPVRVDWVEKDDPDLIASGTMAVAFWNSCVVLVPREPGFNVGDMVFVKIVSYGLEGKTGHSNLIVTKA